jgi:putative nucleotidyltransferase with HDIG domain
MQQPDATEHNRPADAPMSSQGKTRILFVDDQQDLLNLYSMIMESVSDKMAPAFANSGAAALAKMQQQTFDIVVSDMEMPGMNGPRLLQEIARLYPQTIRLILSGYDDEEWVYQCVGTSHQYLAKPFSLETLYSTLERVRALQRCFNHGPLRALVAKIGSLPGMPAIYFRMLELLRNPETSLEDIGKLVASDPNLTANLLKLVNSAYFGTPQKISSAYDAVMCLGLSRLRSLVLAMKILNAFDTQQVQELPLEQIWQHSLLTGTLARKIAQLEDGGRAVAEESFTAGILHDVGKLIFSAHFPQEYGEVLRRGAGNCRLMLETETQMLGATHAEVGAYLLGVWGLPTSLVESVAYHHEPWPTMGTRFCALTAVHVANCLIHEISPVSSSNPPSALNMDYLTQLGLANHVPRWRECAQALLESQQQ